MAAAAASALRRLRVTSSSLLLSRRSPLPASHIPAFSSAAAVTRRRTLSSSAAAATPTSAASAAAEPISITDSSSCTHVNLQASFAKFSDHWSPKVVGEVNGMHVKFVKLEGEFDWQCGAAPYLHYMSIHHDDEDELFMVIKGTMKMQFRDRDVLVNPGEFIIVPKLVEHCPAVPDGEVECMLFEPASTLNTGNVVSDKTVTELDELTNDGDLKRGSGNEYMYNKAKND